MSVPDLIIIGVILLILILSGLPMWIPFALGPLIVIFVYFPHLDWKIIFAQQVMVGLRPIPLTAIPMFIFAADLICRGTGAERLINFVKAWMGHWPGGVATSVAASCTMFGSVSGSAQATLVAIGKPMRPFLLDVGYSSSWGFGLLMTSAGIALLIPPSLSAIIFGVAAETSIGALFLAGLGSGILVFILFAIYSTVYSRWKRLGTLPSVSWAGRWRATKAAAPIAGFPVVVLGGIFTGIFTPTEAAAAAVTYAILVEKFVFRAVGFKDILLSAREAGLILGIMIFLVGLARFLSWTIGYAGISKLLIPPFMGSDPSQLRVIVVILAFYFIATMFIDTIAAIFVLTPLFAPYVSALGIDPVFLGALVILQAAIGLCTPPFGINIFTASVVFNRPYWEVVKNVFPWIAMMQAAIFIIIAFPDIVMIWPRMMIGGY